MFRNTGTTMLIDTQFASDFPEKTVHNSARSHRHSLLLFLLGAAILILSISTVSIFALVSQSVSVLFAFIGFGLFGLLLSLRFGKTAMSIFGAVYLSNVFISIIVVLVYLMSYGTPYYYGGSDDRAFVEYGQQAAQELSVWDYSSIRGQIVGSNYEPAAYVYLVSVLYRFGDALGGFNTLLPRLLNALALGMISVLIFVIANRSKIGFVSARNTALIVGILPIMTFNSANIFRDIPVSLLVLWVFYQWDTAVHYNSRKHQLYAWLWTILTAAVVWQFRPTQAALIILLATGAYFFFVNRPRKNRLATGLVLTLLFLALLTIAFWGGGMAWALQRLGFYMQYYTEYRLDTSSGLSNLIFAAPLPVSIPLRFAYGLISPLPFVGQRFEELFEGAGTVVHYFFLPFLGLGFAYLVRRPFGRLWVWAFILFYSTAMLTFTSRHIVVFLPYAALITAQGFAVYSRYAGSIFLGVLWLGCLLATSYLVLKIL